ncbi:hypothetical protein SDC9_07767 [bioreactor metagenome]|uniref:Uncharacterized protein n=1 Tax=bioreactor metagenome TaxID=1076179 RepID=A0A644T5T0_9ZZZZ|nr:hypothetical protein [Candidatus Elulimicrobiales bacterium]
MQIKTTQLNKDRLNGNKLYLHNFKNFSTNSVKKSFKIYVIHALLSILAILSIAYMVIVVAVIFNIINKKEGLASINDINVKSAKLEKAYNATILNITKEYAFNNGFIETKNNNFATRKDAAASFSFLYEGVNVGPENINQ